MKLSQRDYKIIIMALDCFKASIRLFGDLPAIEEDGKEIKITDEMIDKAIEAVNSI